MIKIVNFMSILPQLGRNTVVSIIVTHILFKINSLKCWGHILKCLMHISKVFVETRHQFILLSAIFFLKAYFPTLLPALDITTGDRVSVAIFLSLFFL